MVNNLFGRTSSIRKPTNPELTALPISSSNSHTPSQYFPCPKSPKAINQKNRDQFYRPEPASITEAIQMSISSFLCHVSPFSQKTLLRVRPRVSLHTSFYLLTKA
jgi:hypothetical protein